MCFLNTASSLFQWHNLAQFGIPYFAHWTPVNQDLQKGTIKQPRTIFPLQWHWSCTPYGPVCPVFHQKQLITIANTSTSDTYVCSYSSLFNHVYIKSDWVHASYKMAWSNVLNCAYMAGLLLPLNRTLIHGVYVKLNCQITWISRNASQKGMGNYGNCMLNALPVSNDIHYCLYYHVSWVFLLPVYHATAPCWSAGSLKHIQHNCQ